MTVSRQPDPSTINNDPGFTDDVQLSPQGADGGSGDSGGQKKSPYGLPPALQEMFDRSADESFMDDLRRKAEEKAERRERERYAAFTKPRPSNVKYEPQARTSDAQRQMDDFGQEPIFEERRTRSRVEYVNVSSPDKATGQSDASGSGTGVSDTVQRSIDDDADKDTTPDAGFPEDDLPDALPGTYTLDDKDPTEAIDMATLESDNQSPKASAPSPASADDSGRLQGQSTPDTIQRSVADEIDEWVEAADGAEFPAFEYGDQETDADASESDITFDAESPSTSATPSRAMTGGIVQPQRDTDITAENADTTGNVQRRVDDTPSADAIQRAVDADVQGWQQQAADFDAPPLDYPAPDAPSQAPATDDDHAGATDDIPDSINAPDSTPTTTGNVQRRVDDTPADSDPAVQRRVDDTPSADAIQRAVDADVQGWQQQAADFDAPPLDYPAPDAPSQAPATDDYHAGATDDIPDSINAPDSTPTTTGNVQRRVDDTPADSDPAVQRRVDDTPSADAIQRAVDADVQGWQQQAADFDAPPLDYPTLNASTGDIPAGPTTGNNTTIAQRRSSESVSSGTNEPSVVRRQLSTQAETAPTVNRATNVPAAAENMLQQQANYIQRAVADEINQWQGSDSEDAPFALDTDPVERPAWEIASIPTEATTLASDGTVSPVSASGAVVQRQQDGLEDTDDPTPLVNADADQLPTQPVSLEHALFSSQASPNAVQRTQQDNSYADLLDLMDLPPDTQVNDGPNITVTAPTPGAGGYPVQRVTDIPEVNAEVTADTDDTDAGSEPAIEKQAQELAEEIYRILQRRFRIDHERKNGRRRL